jgi:hypothetical protein
MSPYRIVFTFLCLLVPAIARGQSNVLDAYLTSQQLKDDFTSAETGVSGGTLQETSIVNLLPQNRSGSFVSYVIATRPALARHGIEALRLNKILQSAASAGGTSAVASAIGPALLGAAIEYGGVLQESTGTTTTLRANLLGLAKLTLGEEQFPYCPAIDPAQCNVWSRRLRRVSGVVSFEPRSAPEEGATPNTTPPSVSDLLGTDYRTSSWGVRIELTSAGRLDDPAYTTAWTSAIVSLRGSPQPAAVTAAVGELFGGSNIELYSDWRAATIGALKAVKTATEFQNVFHARLQALTDALLAADPSFPQKVITASRAFSNYFLVRDELIMKAQVHKASIDYTNQSPLKQPGTSNLRFIYSHQPTEAPLLFTLNAAVTAYNKKPGTGSQLRDVQLAAQLDRRLGEVPNLGHAVFTLAAYYQWMKEDAVLDLEKSLVSSIPGLELADDAVTVLGTKGHIGMVQGKISLRVNDVVSVPLSVTWSNRRELIPEKNTVRGQLGLALDLDSVFK